MMFTRHRAGGQGGQVSKYKDKDGVQKMNSTKKPAVCFTTWANHGSAGKKTEDLGLCVRPLDLAKIPCTIQLRVN